MKLILIRLIGEKASNYVRILYQSCPENDPLDYHAGLVFALGVFRDLSRARIRKHSGLTEIRKRSIGFISSC